MCDRCRTADFVIPRHTMICVVYDLPEATEGKGKRDKQKQDK